MAEQQPTPIPFWEIWPPDAGLPSQYSLPIISDERYVLLARTRADQKLAAAAPDLLRALVGLLRCFEIRNEEMFYVTNEGTGHPIPRHLRSYVPDVRRAAAKAQGRPDGKSWRR